MTHDNLYLQVSVICGKLGLYPGSEGHACLHGEVPWGTPESGSCCASHFQVSWQSSHQRFWVFLDIITEPLVAPTMFVLSFTPMGGSSKSDTLPFGLHLGDGSSDQSFSSVVFCVMFSKLLCYISGPQNLKWTISPILWCTERFAFRHCTMVCPSAWANIMH